ncbi:hypothetical protein AB1046_04025 [Promicromonospora sp. Populi]|uniref:hypothetical protein n=1 Tax=Promicromonospora sp. Populi TaxID=3239420 RepID=UPI0034E294F4
MAVLGAFLAALGITDAFRDTSQAPISQARRYSALAAGLATLAALMAASGLPAPTVLGVGIPLALLLTAWALDDVIGRAIGEKGRRTAAFSAIGAGVVIALLFGGDVATAWPTWVPGPLSEIPPARVILVGGIALVQVTTANVLVRLILDAVNVPTKEGSDRLRSGRVLGPMERLFILGLGLAGNLTAAAVVVGAKGLLRFPELAASESSSRSLPPILIQKTTGNDPGNGGQTAPATPVHQGPNPVTEYFLIGSFASWLLALGSLGLAMLVLG